MATIIAKCPICKMEYQYPEGGYKPHTCNKFDCIHKYLHHPKEYGIKLEGGDKCLSTQ